MKGGDINEKFGTQPFNPPNSYSCFFVCCNSGT